MVVLFQRPRDTKVMAGFLPWTGLLAGATFLFSTIGGFILGLESGAHRGDCWDRGLFAGLMVLGGVPDFFVGTLLLLGFAVIWPVLPLGGANNHLRRADRRGLADRCAAPSGLAAGLPGIGPSDDDVPVVPKPAAVLLRAPFLRTARGKAAVNGGSATAIWAGAFLLPAATSAGLQLSHLCWSILERIKIRYLADINFYFIRVCLLR